MKTFKGRVFEGDGKLSVEEFLYQLQNHFDLGRITEDRDKILVLTSGVAGSAGSWVRQWREGNPGRGFEELIKGLKDRFQDKLKAQKAYNKLLNMRQGKRSVREFNREFGEVLIELGERPAELFLLNVYTRALDFEFASPFADVVPSTLDEAMTRTERREQLKQARELLPPDAHAAKAQEELVASMDLDQIKVTCAYCKKGGHSVKECRLKKKMEQKRKGKCFKCGVKGHMAMDCGKVGASIKTVDSYNVPETISPLSNKPKPKTKKDKKSRPKSSSERNPSVPMSPDKASRLTVALPLEKDGAGQGLDSKA